MRTQWFRKTVWSYRPVSVEGWLVCVLAIVFCASVLISVNRSTHSMSDLLYGIFPYFVSMFTVVGWVASHTSKDKS